jgi:hypothetical protein
MSPTATKRLANAPVILILALVQYAWAADCNQNDVEDSGDIAAGASPDCNAPPAQVQANTSEAA